MTHGREHRYEVTVSWTGNQGVGTSGHKNYKRGHEVTAKGKSHAIMGSADPSFNGDATRWNPEDLLVASLSACHKLWYLGLCAQAGITVTEYIDDAEGMMVEDGEQGGYFTGVVLKPRIKITSDSDAEKAASLHHQAHKKCFIANSVNFPVKHQATITFVEKAG